MRTSLFPIRFWLAQLLLPGRYSQHVQEFLVLLKLVKSFLYLLYFRLLLEDFELQPSDAVHVLVFLVEALLHGLVGLVRLALQVLHVLGELVLVLLERLPRLLQLLALHDDVLLQALRLL